MTHTLNADNHHELPKLLQLIRDGKPGWGSAFADLRRLSGLTQKAIATALDINPATVSHWESSTNRPHPQTLRKALALMVDTEHLEPFFPGTVQSDDDAAKLQAHGETLARMQAALDAVMDSKGDEVEGALQQIKKKVYAEQIEKALKGDTKAAAFVSAWVERSI